MESKKINQLATNVAPQSTDLTIIGDPITGVSKKITWLQVSTLIGTAANLQQVTDNGATTTNPIAIGGLTITGLATGVLKSNSGVIASVPFGAANGVATLGGDGKVPSSQLPSYVDDVVEVANYAALPAIGETGKIYITLDTNKVYRWTGSIYVEIAANNAVWGAITGTLSNQTDLQNALNTKLSSVGLTMPSAFSVANSPLTANGTIAVTGAGVASQYVRGDGTLANFPTSGGGGGSVSYYFNSSVSQGTLGGVAYRELNKVPVIGAGTDITIATNGYIANYITDVGDPALLEIPGGNWNFEVYFSASSAGGTPSFYLELYKYDGTTFTLISSSSATPEGITGGTAIDLYTTALAVPTTALTLTDRLAVRVYVNNSGRTITLHTENSHLCQVITTFSTGITALNGLTAQVQYFGTGTSGTDFNISSATATHTFNLPVASATNTGKLSSTDWNTFNGKQSAITLTTTGTSGAATLVGSTLNIPNYGSALSGYVPYTGATNHLDLGENDLFTRSAIIKQLVKLEGFVSGSITNAAALAIKTSTQGFVYGGTGYVSITSNETNALTVVNESGLWSRISFNSISANRTFTFPNATGTLALTSNLSAYLPLAGGTLTGALNGTSAVFSSTVQASAYRLTGMTAGSGALYWSSDRVTLANYNASGSVVIETGGGTIALTLASNQAATFAGALSGTSATFSGNGSSFGSASAGSYPLTIQTNISEQSIKFIGKNDNNNIQFFDSAGTTYQAVIGTIGSSFIIGTGTSGTTRLTISSTGAATFSSSATATAFIPSGATVPTNGMYLSAANTLNFATNSTERMRITSGGAVCIGTTAAVGAGLLNVKQNATVFNLVSIQNDASIGNFIYFMNSGGTAAGNIANSGGGVLYLTSSDYRLKQDFKDYNGLDLVSKIKTYDYELKCDNSRMYGVKAHELQEVIPYAVNGEKDAKQMQSVDYSKIVPILVKAIQELKAEIDELKNK